MATARNVATAACIAALLGVGTLTLTGAAARAGWLPELATHFRPQYAVALLVLVPALAMLRRPRLAALAAVLLAWNAALVAPYVLPHLSGPAGAAAVDGGTRIVALNLHYRNWRYEPLLDYLGRSDPDVLVLSELTPRAVEALRPFVERYPYWLAVDRPTPWGLGVYSRFPLRDKRWNGLGARDSVNVFATVEAPGGAFALAAVHLSSPTSARRAALRDAQLGALALELGAGPRGDVPRVLVGDLNVTQFSPVFGELVAATGMRDTSREFGLLFTWSARWPPIGIQIDHCIADEAARVVRVSRGPAIGSDHYPLEIELAPRR